MEPLIGQFPAWTKRDGEPASAAIRNVATWRIGPYESSSHGSWVTFSIIDGGVTGYESFVLRDDPGYHDQCVHCGQPEERK